MRISITVIASDVTLSSDFLTIDVPEDMSLDALKALVEAEIGAPTTAQYYLRDGQPIMDTSKTLFDLNIKEDDIVTMAVQNNRSEARQTQTSRSAPNTQTSSRSRGGQDPEQARLRLLGDPRAMEQVRRQNPQLADAATDRQKFHEIWNQMEQALQEEQRRKEEHIALLQADPFNVEAQTKIEEIIRQERIQENLQKALEENPESFGRVIMLYIDVQVNNVPIKAFVDSGAQTTIMSPDAAERCGITNLIDRRWGGIARGVGTAKILGRVHHAEIQIGQYSLTSSFTVMEGKDVDLLLGLDMLKRHQMAIDLRQDCLIVQDDKIPFLPENEIPKMMEELLDKEPKVEGPGGSKIGATTGTVEPGPSTSQPSGSTSNNPAQPQPAVSQQSSEFAFGQAQPITQQSIAQVMELGFSREEAINALRQVNGNVELAIGLLL